LRLGFLFLFELVFELGVLIHWKENERELGERRKARDKKSMSLV